MIATIQIYRLFLSVLVVLQYSNRARLLELAHFMNSSVVRL